MTDGHIIKEEFLLEFFGNFGRELGDPNQHFTDDPMEIFDFIDECARQKKPAFISVQPRTAHHQVYGIEKLFYDFDYGCKSDKLTERQIKHHRKKMEYEVRIFVSHITRRGLIPMIVKTRKGYHIYVYFDRIYEIDSDEGFWRAVYGFLYDMFTKSNKKKFNYADSTSREDIFRLCRIPTSIHQKTGKECIILDTNFKPTKIRSIEYYKSYGLKHNDLVRAVDWVKVDIARRESEAKKREEEHEEKWMVEHGYTGKIRPCFQTRMDAGEMVHQQRLALLIEAYYSGRKKRDEMFEFFKCFNDFNEKTTRTQVNWFFDNKVDESKNKCKVKPYRCDTIREKGWCLKDGCPIYLKQKEKGKIGKNKGKKA